LNQVFAKENWSFICLSDD